MQTKERTIKILKTIVEEYISSGEPVGSKLVCSALDIDVSPATVRNEMVKLTDMGLLTQLHTSAGRQPSEAGFRLYVHSLMSSKTLSSSDKAIISERLNKCSDPDKLITSAAETAANMLNSLAVVTTPFSENERIHRLKFVQIGRQTCMIVLITTKGLVKTKLFKCDYVITHDIVNIYETMFNRDMVGLPVRSVTPAYVQTQAVKLGEVALLVPSVLAAIMDACRDVGEFDIAVSGRERLLHSSENDINELRLLLKFLHSDDSLKSLIMKLRSGSKFLIGSELGGEPLSQFSFAASPYMLEGTSGGFVTVLLPIRYDYAYAEAVLDYISEVTGRLLKEMLMIE